MKSKAGRPSSADYELVVVRDRDTGNTVAWSDGHFAGDGPLKRRARAVMSRGGSVLINEGAYPLTDDARGAAIAMLFACRGRGVIVTGEEHTLPLPGTLAEQSGVVQP